MSPSGAVGDHNGRVTRGELDAVLGACRVLVAISVRSMVAVEDVVGPAQFRALVVIASRRSLSLGVLAAALGTSVSTASRMCDRMVESGLVDRADDPSDRRQILLTLTEDGQAKVAQVMRERRTALRALLARLSKDERVSLSAALAPLVSAGEEPAEHELWSLGWTT